MGKDQELLEAARTGNLQAVKTILSGKLPRSTSGSGGLTGGLRRCEMTETELTETEQSLHDSTALLVNTNISDPLHV